MSDKLERRFGNSPDATLLQISRHLDVQHATCPTAVVSRLLTDSLLHLMGFWHSRGNTGKLTKRVASPSCVARLIS